MLLDNKKASKKKFLPEGAHEIIFSRGVVRKTHEFFFFFFFSKIIKVFPGSEFLKILRQLPRNSDAGNFPSFIKSESPNNRIDN